MVRPLRYALASPCALLLLTLHTHAQCPVTVTDIDGNEYTVLQYGEQCWMGSNLRTSKYSNGATIPTASSNSAWASATTGRYTIYNNSPANNAVHGKLYNWFAVADPRGVCPDGWHVPSDAEWKVLESHMGVPQDELDQTGPRGDEQNVGGKMKIDNDTWLDPNHNATNASGFTATPAGNRWADGTYLSLGSFTSWWSTTGNEESALIRELDYFWGGIIRTPDLLNMGLSCRCVYDQLMNAVPEAPPEQHFSLSPNPTGLTAVLEPYDVNAPYDVYLYDAQGRLIMRHNTLRGKLIVDVSGLRPGVYRVALAVNGAVVNRALVVQ